MSIGTGKRVHILAKTDWKTSWEEAKELLNFLAEYLNYIYIMPAKIAEKGAKVYK